MTQDSSLSQEHPPNIKVLRLPATVGKSGYSRATIYRKMATGEFPTCIKLGKRAVGWFEHEITAWLTKRAEISRNK